MDISMYESITDFVPRYREYASHKDKTDNMIRDLMIYAEQTEMNARSEVAALTTQLRNLQFDHDDSISSQRDLQDHVKNLESQLGFLSKDTSVLKHRNPYVCVLIDGNGLLFKDHLIKQGLEGGKKAAYALRQAVYSNLHNPNDTEIVAKIFGNVDGLAKTLSVNDSDVRDFFAGFTQAKASFDFIEIGHTKPNTKIQETVKFNLRNYNCSQVLLGVSHDPSYSTFLRELDLDRVALLEGRAVAKELINTGVATATHFDAVFRSERPLDRKGSAPSSSAATSSIASTPVSVASVPFSYATVTRKASPPPQLVLPLAPRTNIKTAAVRVTAKPVLSPWNPGPRGLDPPIPLNQNVLDVVKRRTGADKLCNNHYLRGPCAKGDSCCFEHDHTPNPDEIKAIQFLARLNPCTNGQDCDVDNCIYGHHCPSVKDGACTHPFCKFRDHEHPPGIKLKVKKPYE